MQSLPLEEREISPVEDSEPQFDANRYLISKDMDRGLYYTHEGVHRWAIIIARSLTFHVEVSDPESDGSGVTVTWFSQGPSDAELGAMSEITQSSVREFQIPEETSSSVFIPAPKPISNHHGSQKRALIPSIHSKWLVVSFLWLLEEKTHTVAVLEEFDFQKEMEIETSQKDSQSSQDK
jgi:hypothetical protein